MMKYKKGFTLVELLSVIVLIALLLGIGVPGVSKISSNMKKRSLNTKINLIEQAGILYGQDNKAMLQTDNCTTKDGNIPCKKLSVRDLIKNDYLDSEDHNEIIYNDPENNTMLNNCTYIYKKNNRVYSEYSKTDKSCEDTIDTESDSEPEPGIVPEEITSLCDGIPYSDKRGSLAYNIICNAIIAKEEASTEKTVYIENPKTKPAEEISGENERLLLETEDDYTATTGNNSYYFRGNVKDNYVNFAGMCWRIVRITGEGNVKIILEDKNTTCNSDTYTGNWNIGEGYYGVGRVDMIFVDELSHKMNYLEPISDFNPSMVNALYNFQEEDLGLYDRLTLKPGDWCLNDVAYEMTETTPYKYNKLGMPEEGYGLLKDFYYDTYVRLSGNNEKGYQPTFKCNSATIDKFADEMEMYVGAITADEAIYAGSKHSEYDANTSISKNYLLNNNKSFWTLSPSSFNNDGGGDDKAYIISTDGLMYQHHVGSDTSSAFRPVVSLVSGIEIKTGNGTQSNPYVIESYVIE